MYTVNVTVKAPNYDSIRKGVLAISQEIQMNALLPIGSVHYFRVPSVRKSTPDEDCPVIITTLREYGWMEKFGIPGGIILAFYTAESVNSKVFQLLPKRYGFSLMGWRVTESSLG